MDQNVGVGVTLPVPVFDGENYQVWVVKMKAFLKGSDLWEAVEEDYEVTPLGANPTANQIKLYKERMASKAKAMSCIFSAVSPSIFTKIMGLESAKEMWDFLKKEYEGDEKINGMKVMNLLREFERQQMKGSESIKDYVDRLVNIINKVRILGTKVEDVKIVQKILVSIPEKFEATVASLENTKDMSKIKLSEILNALQAQEQRRLMRKEDSVEGALIAKERINSAGNGKFSEQFIESCKHCGKKGHPYWRCWKRPDVKCRKCGKMGHVEKICKEKNTENVEVEANRVEENEMDQLF
ncbi:PREDICTED: uncharacterized protein LOC104801932 [Tarenaya hassleriana]|uniref:uncharacterized protein LOC104801932 n=1 Tax=Tarenaya hassleriana TaxID=28532 RepID=UPI00053C7391|nr:PREDICTED: uncharacterized protein LOC104801932 [Tarenaya hassleriana]